MKDFFHFFQKNERNFFRIQDNRSCTSQTLLGSYEDPVVWIFNRYVNGKCKTKRRNHFLGWFHCSFFVEIDTPLCIVYKGGVARRRRAFFINKVPFWIFEVPCSHRGEAVGRGRAPGVCRGPLRPGFGGGAAEWTGSERGGGGSGRLRAGAWRARGLRCLAHGAPCLLPRAGPCRWPELPRSPLATRAGRPRTPS